MSIIGVGSYGTIFANSCITKEALSDDRIQSQSVNEASILHHLNSMRSNPSPIGYHPFPILYDCWAGKQEVDGDIRMVTKITMSYVGESLNSVFSDAQPREMIMWLRDNLSKLMRVVSLMHAYGVVHRDLHIGNITVDGEGRIYIIDFGTAQLHLDHTPSQFSTAPGPMGIPAADVWMLAASIVIAYNREYASPNREWAVKKLMAEYDYLNPQEIRDAVEEGRDYRDRRDELELEIPLPESIPVLLRIQLSRMLSINPAHRTLTSPIVVSKPVTYRGSYQLSTSVITQFEDALMVLLDEYRLHSLSIREVSVGIDLVCRIVRVSPWKDDYAPAIVSLSTTQEWDDEVTAEVEVMGILQWRVFTADNVVSRRGDGEQLVQAIIEDDHKHEYVSMNTLHLMERLASL